jgi:hypothetical protein
LADANTAFTHFLLNNGIFKCSNIVVNPFTKESLRFMNYSQASNNTITVSQMVYSNITTAIGITHFNLCDGNVNFTDSV